MGTLAAWLPLLVLLVLLPALLYGAALAFIAWRQEALLFYPQVLAADHRFAVAADDVQELWIDVPGARLHALQLKRPAPSAVVYFLHGNGGSLDSWFVDLDFYRRANVDLVMLDYRGYGKSSGRIGSEAQLLADVRAAWQQVAPQYVGVRRVFVGRSLGTGPAAMLAADVQPEATVLVSPYFSMQSLAAEHYPWVPGALLRYPLRTDAAVTRIAGALLLVHGSRDTVIPPAHTERLQALAPRAAVTIIEGAGHNDLQGFAAYRQRLLQLMAP